MPKTTTQTTTLARRQHEIQQAQAELALQTLQVIHAVKTSAARGPSWLPSPDALKNGVHLMGGPGSGKSRLMGRGFAWQAWQQRKPLVVLDPTGGTIDNFIDKLMRLSATLPYEQRARLWERIRYVDVGATDTIVGKPLYFRMHEGETLAQTANRLLAIIKRQDEALTDAPVQGWNAAYEAGIYSGMIATALGKQIDFVADLIRNPQHHKEELRQALSQRPELEPAVSYFRDLIGVSNDLRNRKVGSLLNKLVPFMVDPTMRATFSHPDRGIDWEEVERKGLIVLLDYRTVHDKDQQQFHLLWDFRDFTGYIEHRAMKGRGNEIMLIIDELAALLGQRASGTSVLADDLEELITRYARNFAVNAILAHQNLGQIEERRIQNALMQMGTQIIGVITDPDERLYLARYFSRYDPSRVKKQEPLYMSLADPVLTETSHSYSRSSTHADTRTSSWSSGGEQGSIGGATGATFGETFGASTQVRLARVPTVIDHRRVEFTIDEQDRLLADQFQALGRFQFLMRRAQGEGDLTGKLTPISIAALDAGQYPSTTLLADLYPELRRRSGVPMADLLAAIEHAQPAAPTTAAPAPAPKPRQRGNGKEKPVILVPNGGPAHDQRNGNLSPAPGPGDGWFSDE